MNKVRFFVAIVPFLLCSCYSYVVFPEKYRELPDSAPNSSAFVLNPELDQEYRIMKSSGIFTVSSDSTCPTRIYLHELAQSRACGNTLFPGVFLTLGLLPMYAPDRYYYSFDQISGTDTTHLKFELKVATRVSFWEIFQSQKDLDPKLAKALKGEYLELNN